MKVVHIVPAPFGPGGVVGGAERYAFELARQMADRVPTTLVTFGDGPATSRSGRCACGRWATPGSFAGSARTRSASRCFASCGDADVVHCHQHHVLVSSAAAAWCRLTGKRVFVSDLGGGGWDVSAYVSTDCLVPRPPALERIQPSHSRPRRSRARAGHWRRRRYPEVLAGLSRSARGRRALRRPSASAQRRVRSDSRTSGRHAAHRRRSRARSRDEGATGRARSREGGHVPSRSRRRCARA